MADRETEALEPEVLETDAEWTPPNCYACGDPRASHLCVDCTAQADIDERQAADRLEWIRETCAQLQKHRFSPPAVIGGPSHGDEEARLKRDLADELRGLAKDLGVSL